MSVVFLGHARAGGGHYYPPVSDPVVKETCGGCHIAFPPSMLPAKSWERITSQLKNHFGNNVSVDAETAARITGYLVANAADTGGRAYSEKLLRGISAASVPARITELPKWVREHRKVPAGEWARKDVMIKANCLACHADAERGNYHD